MRRGIHPEAGRSASSCGADLTRSPDSRFTTSVQATMTSFCRCRHRWSPGSVRKPGSAMRALVRIDTTKICDWASFHDVFSETFGFPDFYGRNMDAWIDCMTSLDDPGAGMSKIHAPEGSMVTLQLDGV